jgi:hypothetical protein
MRPYPNSAIFIVVVFSIIKGRISNINSIVENPDSDLTN